MSLLRTPLPFPRLCWCDGEVVLVPGHWPAALQSSTINIHKRIIHQQFSIPRPVLMASIIYITLPRYCHGRPQRKEKYLWMWRKRLFFNLKEGYGGVEANCNYISVEKDKQWWQNIKKWTPQKQVYIFCTSLKTEFPLVYKGSVIVIIIIIIWNSFPCPKPRLCNISRSKGILLLASGAQSCTLRLSSWVMAPVNRKHTY